jgi:hypothetical protein
MPFIHMSGSSPNLASLPRARWELSTLVVRHRRVIPIVFRLQADKGDHVRNAIAQQIPDLEIFVSGICV